MACDIADGAKAALAQFDDVAVTRHFWPMVRSEGHVERILVEITKKPSVSLLKSASAHSITVSDGATDTYRLRTVALPDNEYVILATSLSAQIESRDANIRLLIWFVLGSVLFGAVAIALFIRRDVRKISRLVDAAGLIADGDSTVALPGGNGQSEVDRLARALRHMVESLQHSIEVERNTQQSMQTFLGDASHELRTPLTALRLQLEAKPLEETPASVRTVAHASTRPARRTG